MRKKERERHSERRRHTLRERERCRLFSIRHLIEGPSKVYCSGNERERKKVTIGNKWINEERVIENKLRYASENR